MFTLMPVAAFAAEAPGKVMVSVEGATAKNSVTAKNNESVALSVTGSSLTVDGYYYIIADADGEIVDITNVASFVAGTVFDVNGTYTVTAVGYKNEGSDKAAAVKTVVNDAMTDLEEKATLLLGKTYESVRIDKTAKITVKYVESTYNIDIYTIDADAQPYAPVTGDLADLKANGVYGAATYAVKLTTAAGNEVEGATIKVSHNGVNAPKQIVTNEDGVAYLKIYGTVVGDFNVTLSYGDKKVTRDVAVKNVVPTEVSVVAQPQAPVDVNETSAKFGIAFKFVDGNGNVIDRDGVVDPTPVTGNCKIAVTGPVDSNVKATDLDLLYVEDYNGFVLTGINPNSELAEGTYTFTVSLESGSSASASVTVKEFDEPVALKLMYSKTSANTTAGLGDTVGIFALKYVDAAGVTKDATGDIGTDVKLSVSGKAVADFDVTDGTVVVRTEDKYVGEVIKVVAVYDETLVATAEITVVEDAVALQYVAGDVQAAANNILVFNVVNEAGEKISLNRKAATVTTTSAIVVEKPEGAYVATSVVSPTNVTDKVKVNFTPSVAGEYEVMVVVAYTDVNAYGADVVRSVTGTATINVGGTDTFKDVVVVSINADKIIVNNEVKAIPAAAVIKDSRTFVPFRALAEAFGAVVDYDQATGAVTAELNGVKVVMMNGDKAYTVNGVAKVADVAPYLNVEASTTMVPVSFVANAFGINYQCIYAEDGTVADVLFTK